MTTEDIARAKQAVAAGRPDTMPVSMRAAPPAGLELIVASAAAPAPVPQPGSDETGKDEKPVPTADDYLTKLLKYIPPEIVGAYMFVASVVQSNVSQPRDLSWWLGALLVLMVALSAVYCRRVLNIERVSQIAVSCVGLAVYVFAIGGWFATTTWYHPWYGSIVLPFFGFAVAIIRLRPLPDDTPVEPVEQSARQINMSTKTEEPRARSQQISE